MIRLMTRRTAVALASGIVATLLFAGPASALIPVPFFPPTGGTTGDPDPPLPPDPPCDKPPDPCIPHECPPGTVNATPEPGTIISALVGASLAGGYVLRRKGKK